MLIKMNLVVFFLHEFKCIQLSEMMPLLKYYSDGVTSLPVLVLLLGVSFSPVGHFVLITILT